MHSRMPILAAALVMALLPAQTAFADDLKGVLSRLDTAAANFHTTTTNFEFDTVTTQPIYDKDVQIRASSFSSAKVIAFSGPLISIM